MASSTQCDPGSYDFSRIDPGTPVATGQPPPEFSATSEADGGYPPPGWDSGMFDVEMSLPLDPPGTSRGQGSGLQPLGPWDSGANAYSALMGGTMAIADAMSQYIPVKESNRTYYAPRDDTVTMADSRSQYAPVEEPPGGCFDPFSWPPPWAPPMGQMSPSPSQSSYYASSPASVGGAHFSRHNSFSSLPALNTSAIEYSRSDVRLRSIPGQALSPDEARSSPAGTVAANGPYLTRESTASAQNHTGSATTTTDYSGGIVSPAMTPSPRNRIATFADQPPGRQLARHEPDQQNLPKASRKQKALAPGRRTATQKKQGAEGPAQQQQQQQQQQPAPRTRNRDAANKCRAKTKQAMADLESAERVMSSEHQELSAVARGLRDEVLMLKHELLAHGNCDDSLIQQYLASQARKVGYGAAQQAQQAQLHQPQHQQLQGLGGAQ